MLQDNYRILYTIERCEKREINIKKQTFISKCECYIDYLKQLVFSEYFCL